MKAKDWFSDFGRGAALGTGILPGVSVGTVGLIVNVYDKLLGSISGLTKKFWKNLSILIPIAIGTLLSAAILLWGYSHLQAYASFEIISLLAGLIIGGLPIICKEIPWKELKAADDVRMILGLVVAAGIGVVSAIAAEKNWFDVTISHESLNAGLHNYLYTSLPVLHRPHQSRPWFDFGAAFENPNANPYIYVVTFFVGFVAAVACLLPGISGSMVLFIFGLYNPVVALYSGENSMLHNHDRIGTGLILTLILFVGVVVGLVAFAKIMKALMERHHRGTFTTVFGLIIGSLISMFINKDAWLYYKAGNAWWHYVLGGFLLIAGCALMLFLVKKTQKQEVSAPEEENNAEDVRAE